MSEWTQDHTATLEYQTTYFSELNPGRIALVLANQRLRSGSQMLNACELGYGTGLSTVIHATASEVQWWGTDYNPGHAQFANELIQEAGVHATLSDNSFEEFCNRADLPEFDFIALHGVWSWISDTNRTVIVDFIRRKLRVGGTLYVSYNTLPAHAQMVPLRDMMKSYMEQMTSPGQSALERGRAACQFVKELLDNNPHLAAIYPQAKATIDHLMAQPPSSYVNHEYLVDHWTPMSFCDVHRTLSEAKLQFACSALPTHHNDGYFLSAPQRDMLMHITDFATRETTRDFLVHRRFRQDYWVKGGLHMSPDHARQSMQNMRVVLLKPASTVNASIPQATQANLIPNDTFEAVVAALSDGVPHAVSDLLASPGLAGFDAKVTIEALLNLVGNGSLSPVQSDATIAAVAPRVLRLNAALCAKAMHSADVSFLASAVTGGGISVGQLHMQFLALRATGLPSPREWAIYMARSFQQAGVHLVREGNALTTLDAMVAHILELAQSFEDQTLPRLQKLRCVE